MIADVMLFGVCLFGFLKSSSTSRLYRGRAPRQSVWQFYVLPHMRQSWETMSATDLAHDDDKGKEETIVKWCKTTLVTVIHPFTSSHCKPHSNLGTLSQDLIFYEFFATLKFWVHPFEGQYCNKPLHTVKRRSFFACYLLAPKHVS